MHRDLGLTPNRANLGLGENNGARAGDCSRAVMGKRVGLLFTAVAVAAHELVDAAGGVDELLLAGEEGVRRAGDFEFHQGVFNAIDGDGFASGDGRAGDEHFFVRHVFECNRTIVVGMDAFFHCYNVIF